MTSTIHTTEEEIHISESAAEVSAKLEKADLFGLTFILVTEINDVRNTRSVVLNIEGIEKVEGSWWN